MKVIIIDDDSETIEVLTEYLQINGIDVIAEGKNGLVAFELYQSAKPDIVFMDVMMPEYDGFYGLKMIKEFDPDAKVIMVTADLTADTDVKLEQLNASKIIKKPFSLVEIKNAIDDISK